MRRTPFDLLDPTLIMKSTNYSLNHVLDTEFGSWNFGNTPATAKYYNNYIEYYIININTIINIIININTIINIIININMVIIIYYSWYMDIFKGYNVVSVTNYITIELHGLYFIIILIIQ